VFSDSNFSKYKKSELMVMRCESIRLISFAGCIGVSPEISVKIHSLSVRRSLKSRQIH